MVNQLLENSFIVKKLGGENASMISRNIEAVVKDHTDGLVQALVVSAMRSDSFNTTDKLKIIGDGIAKLDFALVSRTLSEIEDFHLSLISNEFKGDDVGYGIVSNTFKVEFGSFRNMIDSFMVYVGQFGSDHNIILPSKENDYIIGSGERKLSVIGFGEQLSASILASSFNSKHAGIAESVDTAMILSPQSLASDEKDALSLFSSLYSQLPKDIKDHLEKIVPEDFLKNAYLEGLVRNGETEKRSFATLTYGLANRVDAVLQRGVIPVVPGYVGIFPRGIENAVGRGYSDATAAALAVGISDIYSQSYGEHKNVVLQIQKAVEGLLSCDPRMLDHKTDAKLIKFADYVTAKEIIGVRSAQAKLLHNQALRPEVLEHNISINLVDPFSGTDGSWILPKLDDDKILDGVQFIGGRTGVHFVSISSGGMGLGFLARVSSILAEYVSVDIISASETEISFTCDSKSIDGSFSSMINELKDKLNLLSDSQDGIEFVEVLEDQALIFCIGSAMKDKTGILAKAADAFKDSGINVELVSQGRLQRAMTFGVASQDLKRGINALHNAFISKD